MDGKAIVVVYYYSLLLQRLFLLSSIGRNGGTSSPRGQQPIAPAGVCRNPGANNVETDGCPVSHAAGGASSNDGKLSKRWLLL